MATGQASLPPLDTTRAPEGGEVGAVQSGWRLALREFVRNRLAVVGVGILLFFVVFCFLGPFFYHADLLDVSLINAHDPPGAGHPLGADTQGFDVLGELMKGGQAALEIGFFAAFVAITIGALVGAVAGLAGGIVDTVLMRVVDIFLSIPFLFVVLILASRYGASVLPCRWSSAGSPGRCRPGWCAARCSRSGNATSSWPRGRRAPAAGG